MNADEKSELVRAALGGWRFASVPQFAEGLRQEGVPVTDAALRRGSDELDLERVGPSVVIDEIAGLELVGWLEDEGILDAIEQDDDSESDLAAEEDDDAET